MLDEVTGEWGVPRRPVVADADYGDATEFRLGLSDRELVYVLAVSPTATVHPGALDPSALDRITWPKYGRPEKRWQLRGDSSCSQVTTRRRRVLSVTLSDSRARRRAWSNHLDGLLTVSSGRTSDSQPS
ncbi:SRSO17 transposase [Kibdelosporangium phytohabitans]|uniref:Transposase IS701-like DDE domain-containing protein n=1 Tax=Kibdelosporangium phytohabitans TaxID=860235 RepID=A0A0N7F2N2_9PSEU|nr:hypothetical protein AOZ06_04630 [Kibdelosporangium phytohabitans]MBE1467423.1 SRSO17 transposase [Kibdelosporangium phytohabitans]